MKITKEQRDALRDVGSLGTLTVRDVTVNLSDLLDDFDELERRERQHYNAAIDAIVQLATTRSARDCGAEPHDPCALPPGNICDAHTIAELHRELAVAREKRPDTDTDTGYVRLPAKKLPNYADLVRGFSSFPTVGLTTAEVAEIRDRVAAAGGSLPVVINGEVVGEVRTVTGGIAWNGGPWPSANLQATGLVDALPEYQLAPVEREAPARVLAVLTRR